MTSYIALADAVAHLREDYPDSVTDGDIQNKLENACSIVRDYLDVSDTEWVSSTGEPEDPPGYVVAATLLVLGELYKEREAMADPISPGVVRLLMRKRTPVVSS